MTPHSRLPRLPRLALSLAAGATLCLGAAASATVAADAASASDTATARASASGLDPVRVSPNGSFSIPVSGSSVVRDYSVTGLGHQLGVGSLQPGSRGLVRLSAAGLRTLQQHTVMTAQVHTGAGGGAAETARSITLVSPSVTPVLGGNRTNPLAGVDWANYEGIAEPTYVPYERAHGATKDALAAIELQPKARWFVSNVSPADLGRKVHDYVTAATASDPNALVQLTMFTIDPWEDAACHALPTKHQLALDKAYIQHFAQGIGSARAVVVVQPDGPYAGCAPHHSKVLQHLVGSAVHQLAQLPRTTSYIDMGSSDWHRDEIGKELPLLLHENIKQARGFSMDVTHTDPTGPEILHAHKLIKALNAHGIKNKHAVIDTSDNGRGFGGQDWRPSHPNQGPWAAPACHSKKQRLCVSLGIPPTTDVANKRWGLTSQQRALAAKEVDAYLWIKRPWLDPFKHYQFSYSRALDEIRTSPYL